MTADLLRVAAIEAAYVEHALTEARHLQIDQPHGVPPLALVLDAVQERLGITKRFYDRFLPAMDADDFALSRPDSSFLGKSLDVIAVCRR